jgi:hypothetical protein
VTRRAAKKVASALENAVPLADDCGMSDTTTFFEVRELDESDVIPATASRTAYARLAVPPGGVLPAVGDLISFEANGVVTRFLVKAREHNTTSDSGHQVIDASTQGSVHLWVRRVRS